MKIFFLCFCIFPALTQASIPPDIINIANTCAYEKTNSNKMVYQSLANTASYIDDNDSSKERTIYIKDDRHVIGYVESNKRNGFLYDKKFYPLSNTIFLEGSEDYLNYIDYTLISWGYVIVNSHKYICANIPFSGTGESGKYQYIRSAYVFNADKKIEFCIFLF
ncbi:TPA: hypothetical protein I8287_004690 [Kluyvera intermedia]|nr:hypothetical protein [Kluyvera intermedia]